MVETLAFTLLSELSILDEEFDRLKLLVWFVEMLALAILRRLSTLEEEFERLKLDV